MVFLIYFFSCVYKLLYSSGYACPLCQTKLKKLYWRIPNDFKHYNTQFDFTCDDTIEMTSIAVTQIIPEYLSEKKLLVLNPSEKIEIKSPSTNLLGNPKI